VSERGRSSLLGRLARAIVGRPLTLPAPLATEYPELLEARYRVGGLPPRIGGWFLGVGTVAGITLWRTVWLAPQTRMAPALLLHELGHVRQFGASRSFPALYCIESLRRGYSHNRFELDAESFARERLAARRTSSTSMHAPAVDVPSEGI
jgi:hypothetical protein